MKPETLFTCPSCQRSGFSARGLGAHECKALGRRLTARERLAIAGHAPASDLPPIASPMSTAIIAPSSSVIDIEPAAQTPADAWCKAKRYVELTGHYLAASCAAQVLAGIELLALKARYPETRGRKKSFHKEGIFDTRTWEQAVKAELGVAQNTAWRWMEMGKIAKQRLAKNQTDLAALLDQPPSALTEAERDALKQAVHKITDGQTQSELMLDWGITKAPQGSAAKGGDTRAAAAANAAEPAEPNPDLPEAQGWDLQAHSLNNILLSGIQQGWWRECTEAKLKELHGNLLDLTSQVSDALKGRAGK